MVVCAAIACPGHVRCTPHVGRGDRRSSSRASRVPPRQASTPPAMGVPRSGDRGGARPRRRGRCRRLRLVALQPDRPGGPRPGRLGREGPELPDRGVRHPSGGRPHRSRLQRLRQGPVAAPFGHDHDRPGRSRGEDGRPGLVPPGPLGADHAHGEPRADQHGLQRGGRQPGRRPAPGGHDPGRFRHRHQPLRRDRLRQLQGRGGRRRRRADVLRHRRARPLHRLLPDRARLPDDRWRAGSGLRPLPAPPVPELQGLGRRPELRPRSHQSPAVLPAGDGRPRLDPVRRPGPAGHQRPGVVDLRQAGARLRPRPR